MKTKLFIFIFFALCLGAIGDTFSQTYTQIKKADTNQIDSLAKDVSPPAQAEMRYWFESKDMNAPTYQPKTEKLKDTLKYQKLLKANSEDLESYRLLHHLYYYKNPKDTATYYNAYRTLVKKYEEKLAKNDKQGEVFYQLAQCAMELKDYVKAFDWAIAGKNAMPDSAKTYHQLAVLNNVLGDYANASRQAKEALKRNDKILDYYITAVTADFFTAMHKKIADSSSTPLQIEKKYIAEAAKKYPLQKEFATLYQTTLLLETFYEIFMNFANQNEKIKDSKELKKTMQKLVSKDPRLTELQGYFEKLSKQHKGSKSFIYNSLGLIYFLQGKVADGKTFFGKAIAENPEKAQIYTNLTFIHLVYEEYAAAEEVLLRKLKIAEEETDLLVLAEVYNKQKKTTQRDETINKALIVYPQNYKYLFYKALNSYDEQQYEQSFDFTLKALQVGGNNDKDAVLHYALLCLRLDKMNEALDALYFASTKQNNPIATKLFAEYFELK